MSSRSDLSESMWEALRALSEDALVRSWGGFWVREGWYGQVEDTGAPIGEPSHRVQTLRALERRGLVAIQGPDHANGSRCVLEPAGRKVLMEVEMDG